MRGKRAKQIRRVVQARTAGMPDVSYIRGKLNVRLLPDGIDEHGKPKFRQFLYTGTIRLLPTCTHSVYRRVKDKAKRFARLAA